MKTYDQPPPLPIISGIEFRRVPPDTPYAVSSDGRAWTCRQRNSSGKFTDWRELKLRVRKDSYVNVKISFPRGRARLLHMGPLMLLCFKGPCPPGIESRHLDGNRGNNKITNLDYGTKLQNEADKDRHGTRPRGDTVKKRKISSDDARAIFAAKGKQSAISLGRHYGLDRQTIYDIWHKKKWKSIHATVS